MRYRVSEILRALATEQAAVPTEAAAMRAVHAFAVAVGVEKRPQTIDDVLRVWPTWIRRALRLDVGTIDVGGRIPRVSDDEVKRVLVAEAQRLGVPLRACHEDAGDEPGAAGW